jgi:hypothetical protein
MKAKSLMGCWMSGNQLTLTSDELMDPWEECKNNVIVFIQQSNLKSCQVIHAAG